MATTPSWSAARNGLPGDPGAVDGSALINQLLGTHPSTVIYQGAAVVTPSSHTDVSGETSPWTLHTDAFDYDQPFVMSGTAIGRVTIPVLPVGNGADLKVSLCADSSGQPGTVIMTTRIPASWITQLAAVQGVAGASSQPLITDLTGSLLATAQFNTLTADFGVAVNWPYPAASSGGVAAGNPQSTYSGNYFIQVGGSNASGTYVNDVFTIACAGGTTLNPAVPQPSLPAAQAIGCALAVTSNPSDATPTVVVAGGATGSTSSFTVVATVYTASLDQGTGTVSSWSNQTALPQALYNCGSAASGDTVYVVGGIKSDKTTTLNTVYFATVQNGQIPSWSTGPALPQALYDPFVGVCNGFLFVMGGLLTGGTAVNTVYYAPITSNGSLGGWQTGPPLPAAAASPFVQDNTMPTGFGLLLRPNGALWALGVTADGPAGSWYQATINSGADDALFPTGAGLWNWFEVFASEYLYNAILLTPMISVPLPSTGLTNGATYHVLIQQRGGDVDNYLRLHYEYQPYGGGTSGLLVRARGTGVAWSTYATSQAIPVTVYDHTCTGPAWHTWDDSGARVSTLVTATTPDQRLLGICESVYQPSPPLNAQPTFVSGAGYWSVFNGTLTTSTAQLHGGVPVSGLITPNGVSSQCYIESEQEAVYAGDAYNGDAWVYSPLGYTNVAVSINWYTSGGAYISTSSGTTTSVSAATWTPLTNHNVTAPATAAKGTVIVVEGSTPPASATLYVSTVTLTPTDGQRLASVGSFDYAAPWPSLNMWPPLGTTALA